MKEIIFVTATNTDVGKSYACEILLNRYAKEGKKVGYFKPIETGVLKAPIDGTRLQQIAYSLNPNFNFTIDQIVPYQFTLPAAPFIAKGDSSIDIDLILQQTQILLEQCDLLIVEGAGGLMVPIEIDFFMIDLIKLFQKKLDAKVVLIVPTQLGSINDTLLSMRALDDKKIQYSWYINLFKDKDSFKKITLPFYKEYFDKIAFL